MIPFNRPPYTGNEDQYVYSAMRSDKISGDGAFSRDCHQWFEERLDCKRALLTPSCTHALEMCALLINVQPGDEVIMPSYTFVSTANAFALRGAKIVFVDIRQDTLNIDERLIETAITDKTTAIVPVHYAGVACEMDAIMALAQQYGLWVIEDAAQGLMANYKGQPTGTIGHLGAYSFHETKNLTSGGEGGLLIINDEKFISRAEVIREKGTNRSKFFRGEVDKYTWEDLGSSYLLSELQAAYLWGQIEYADELTQARLTIWKSYWDKLLPLAKEGFLELPKIPDHCTHNGHLFYIKLKDLSERTALLSHLKETGIHAVFHYVPLHTAPAAAKFGRFVGDDRFTTQESERVVRLPMYYGLKEQEIEYVVESVSRFFSIK